MVMYTTHLLHHIPLPPFSGLPVVPCMYRRRTRQIDSLLYRSSLSGVVGVETVSSTETTPLMITIRDTILTSDACLTHIYRHA